MCKDCGCGGHAGATEINCKVNGYTETGAKQVEKALLGLPGVLYVHIHVHDGATKIQYQANKTSLGDIQKLFARYDLTMAL